MFVLRFKITDGIIRFRFLCPFIEKIDDRDEFSVFRNLKSSGKATDSQSFFQTESFFIMLSKISVMTHSEISELIPFSLSLFDI